MFIKWQNRNILLLNNILTLFIAEMNLNPNDMLFIYHIIIKLHILNLEAYC